MKRKKEVARRAAHPANQLLLNLLNSPTRKFIIDGVEIEPERIGMRIDRNGFRFVVDDITFDLNAEQIIRDDIQTVIVNTRPDLPKAIE